MLPPYLMNDPHGKYIARLPLSAADRPRRPAQTLGLCSVPRSGTLPPSAQAGHPDACPGHPLALSGLARIGPSLPPGPLRGAPAGGTHRPTPPALRSDPLPQSGLLLGQSAPASRGGGLSPLP